MLYQIAYIISRNFRCDAIIPVVKLFWCVALEPMAGSKCKRGQGQWALKLESCCDVIKTLFSTPMAGQDNVSAIGGGTGGGGGFLTFFSGGALGEP